MSLSAHRSREGTTGCMQRKHPNKKLNSKNQSKSNHKHDASPDLEAIADDLINLSKKMLPQGVLNGVIRGQEEDIRQEAIMMALGWYLREAKGHARSWHAPRALAGALRIAKRDRIKSGKKELETQQGVALEHHATSLHPSMISCREWPFDAMQLIMFAAIQTALRNGKITHVNAAIAKEVLVDGVQVLSLAKRLGVHRSNIYQHLTRVRRHLPEIIDRIEVPLNLIQ